jgi:hypothetical protein
LLDNCILDDGAADTIFRKVFSYCWWNTDISGNEILSACCTVLIATIIILYYFGNNFLNYWFVRLSFLIILRWVILLLNTQHFGKMFPYDFVMVIRPNEVIQIREWINWPPQVLFEVVWIGHWFRCWTHKIMS